MIRVANREALLDLMPIKGCHVAEIGVLDGCFSEEIFKREPLYLSLVDPWQAQPKTHYDDINSVDQKTFDAHYKEVNDKFGMNTRVKICKDFSLVAARKYNSEYFEDGDQLSLCYVDANHSFGNTFADLVAWSMNVKSGGYIAVHDYTGIFYGVRQAVHEFCKVTGNEITHQTQEINWQTVAIQIK